ncbi:unnamed protein product [Cyprideis torosa]|uniref:Uncharacterized protein n=1 Tax=Cyprideis torosa TaxID=163714 RepID=A0A7R8W5M7_9CRUS|nr:unnamed protein product [Cyprideis torosa]CAG0885482.1 unnamed protein product [Cyprideis torosa]
MDHQYVSTSTKRPSARSRSSSRTRTQGVRPVQIVMPPLVPSSASGIRPPRQNLPPNIRHIKIISRTPVPNRGVTPAPRQVIGPPRQTLSSSSSSSRPSSTNSGPVVYRVFGGRPQSNHMVVNGEIVPAPRPRTSTVMDFHGYASPAKAIRKISLVSQRPPPPAPVDPSPPPTPPLPPPAPPPQRSSVTPSALEELAEFLQLPDTIQLLHQSPATARMENHHQEHQNSFSSPAVSDVQAPNFSQSFPSFQIPDEAPQVVETAEPEATPIFRVTAPTSRVSAPPLVSRTPRQSPVPPASPTLTRVITPTFRKSPVVVPSPRQSPVLLKSPVLQSPRQSPVLQAAESPVSESPVVQIVPPPTPVLVPCPATVPPSQPPVFQIPPRKSPVLPPPPPTQSPPVDLPLHKPLVSVELPTNVPQSDQPSPTEVDSSHSFSSTVQQEEVLPEVQEQLPEPKVNELNVSQLSAAPPEIIGPEPKEEENWSSTFTHARLEAELEAFASSVEEPVEVISPKTAVVSAKPTTLAFPAPSAQPLDPITQIREEHGYSAAPEKELEAETPAERFANETFMRKYEKLFDISERVQEDTEKVIDKISEVKKSLKRLKAERSFIATRLLKHGDPFKQAYHELVNKSKQPPPPKNPSPPPPPAPIKLSITRTRGGRGASPPEGPPYDAPCTRPPRRIPNSHSQTNTYGCLSPLRKRRGVWTLLWKMAADVAGTVTKTVILNNGVEMPTLGIGTWMMNSEEADVCIREAIALGYRHVDTASYYNNEEGVGRALRAKIQDGTVQRKDLFVTTKLWSTFHRPSAVLPALEQSLSRLGLPFVDLFLVHWPMAFKEGGPLMPLGANGKVIPADGDFDVLDTWKKMEEAVEQLQQRFLAIPKSVNPARLQENMRSFDFEISSEDMSEILKLDKGKRGRLVLFDPCTDHPDYPFALDEDEIADGKGT